MEIKVAKVIDEYMLVINKGSDDGIKDGQRFLIYAIGDEVTDPDTGEPLGKLEIVKGTGRVTHCQAKLSTVSSDMQASARRTVRHKPSPLRGLMSAMEPLYLQETEETLPAQKVPFEAAKAGDLVKPI